MLDKRVREEREIRLEGVAHMLDERFKRAEADEIKAFFEQFYARVPTEDVNEASAENLYGAALSLWKFAAQRTADQTKLRVYNPRMEEHGWKSPHTIVEIVTEDMPFLVDSITSNLNQWDCQVHLAIHPVVRLRRGDNGAREELLPPVPNGKPGLSEAVMHIQIAEQSDPGALQKITDDLCGVLRDIHVAVSDWPAMLAQLDDTIANMKTGAFPQSKAEVAESEAFLAWMRENHFTLLGCRDYSYKQGTAKSGSADQLDILPGTSLGIFRDEARNILTRPDGNTAAATATIAQQFIRRDEILLVTKTGVRGTVHRPVHMDYIGVKRYNGKGKLIGERRFVGLFTSSAFNRTPRDIPLLRRKLSLALEQAGLEPSSHDGKALTHILETYPRDELWQIDVPTLTRIATGILDLQERPRFRLFARRDTFERYFTVLVYMPRERLNTELRERFTDLLCQAVNGRLSNYYTEVTQSPLARVHFILGINAGGVPEELDFAAIEKRLIAAARDWQDDFYDALVDHWGEEGGNRLAARYGKAFPTSYTEHFNAEFALRDIDGIEVLNNGGDVSLNIYRMIEDGDHVVRFKIYHPGQALPLSDCLPMMENMGLRVIGEEPYRIALAGEETIWIHNFLLEEQDGEAVDLTALKAGFEEAFAKVWRGEVEDDGFNRLVLKAGLGWRHVVVLRTLCKYLRQTGIAYSQDYMEETLARNHGITNMISALFQVRFDPAATKGRQAKVDKLIKGIMDGLEAVESLDEDGILRRFLNLIQAALRTNYFQVDENGQPKTYLSIKFDSQAVDELPLPRPFREIFVYSPRVEGVHLRGGKVARGGLRWSDRREDFRTEVLGLMKAQMVKNAVIVPVGSKGGFVPKRLPPIGPGAGGREAAQEEAIACYKTFIRGLLDVTDNLSGTDVVPPPLVERYDEDDPYLVVAADKGTATFSDIANGVAIDYGFWLGDAFASGGAKGYDHKVMGITARGAWESVKRHFREMGRDIQNEDFTVVGCGDMSGDVFGNGMLLSKHIRLLAAFDHRNIFIDPSPDAAVSWRERERLFALPRSSWEDYEGKLISKGGGVFDRKAKAIDLSPEMTRLTGLQAKSVTPNELIHALLQAEADLLWFGGIGTYIKAASESDLNAGDRANDAVRINGSELRAKVVGEGGNLGITQLGRLEIAQAGGRLNSDAIDNSAGVDCSDHEVNIKVLIDAVVADGEMTDKQRNRLLVEMTDEVGELVLRDNYLQTQSLSVLEQQAPALLESHARYMRDLERDDLLDREVEFLPDDEALADRAADGKGLTRPELSVLLSYAKMELYDKLLASDVTKSEGLVPDLIKYFPRPLRHGQREAILKHRLRPEIIATVLANSIVNRVGITFVHDVIEETGASVEAISRSYAAARDLFDMRHIWGETETLDNNVATALQTEIVLSTAGFLRRMTLWFLQNAEQPLRINSIVTAFGPGVASLSDQLGKIVGSHESKRIAAGVAALVKQGVPEAMARRIEGLVSMTAACDIVQVAADCDRPVVEVGQVHFALGARLGLDRLCTAAEALEAEDYWQRQAITSIVDDLRGQQRALTSVVLRQANGAAGEKAVEKWCVANEPEIRRSDEMIAEFEAGGIDIAKLALANRYMRRLIIG
ncbi:MAG: NAD-glutamate dehydrogenase [Rhodospirillaceae bacterium]|nr:NAD-glutamate dehydrogenase [Rhodospirillaceae bacterium]MBT5879418.1 NAD-glutamate dehydrogenase [Rhodospirillaceae bacterium]